MAFNTLKLDRLKDLAYASSAIKAPLSYRTPESTSNTITSAAVVSFTTCQFYPPCHPWNTRIPSRPGLSTASPAPAPGAALCFTKRYDRTWTTTSTTITYLSLIDARICDGLSCQRTSTVPNIRRLRRHDGPIYHFSTSTLVLCTG